MGGLEPGRLMSDFQISQKPPLWGATGEPMGEPFSVKHPFSVPSLAPLFGASPNSDPGEPTGCPLQQSQRQGRALGVCVCQWLFTCAHSWDSPVRRAPSIGPHIWSSVIPGSIWFLFWSDSQWCWGTLGCSGVQLRAPALHIICPIYFTFYFGVRGPKHGSQ